VDLSIFMLLQCMQIVLNVLFLLFEFIVQVWILLYSGMVPSQEQIFKAVYLKCK
jgi:hypothetical protein